MRIISTSANAHLQKRNNASSFKGHWETRAAKSFYYYDSYRIYNYVPEENESLKNIVKAWKEKTGYTPYEWAQKHNMYNQIGNGQRVEYRLNDSPYLPIELLKESLKEKIKEDKITEKDSVENHIRMAWLHKQNNHQHGVKEEEAFMKSQIKNCKSIKLIELLTEKLDSYRKDLGSKLKNAELYLKGEEYEDAYKNA